MKMWSGYTATKCDRAASVVYEQVDATGKHEETIRYSIVLVKMENRVDHYLGNSAGELLHCNWYPTIVKHLYCSDTH